MAVSKNNIPTRNDMFQAMPMNNGIMAQPSIAEEQPELSVDQDFFHKIHNIEIGEKSNKDLFVREREEAIIVEKEEKEKQEALRDGVTIATAELEKMFDINGHKFSNADLEETLDDIIEDKDAFAAKHGLTEEEADRALEMAAMMKSMTQEEREVFLNEQTEKDPKVVKAITHDAEEIHLNANENKLDPTQTASISETQRQAEILSSVQNGNEGSAFDNLSKAQTTGTTASFNAEVSGASNDIEPQVKVAELAPAPF